MASPTSDNRRNNFLTLSSTQDTSDIVSSIKKDLLESIENGVTAYKSLMDQLLETKQPFKDTQLTKFHEKNLQVITEALKSSYEEIMKIGDPGSLLQISQLVKLASQRLEIKINRLFSDTYLRKHEIEIAGVVKKVKGLTNHAEMVYDEKAENFNLEVKSLIEVKEAHLQWAKESMAFFKTLLQDNDLEEHTFWNKELKHRLQERGEDLIAEWKAITVHEPYQDERSVTVNQITEDLPTLETKLNTEEPADAKIYLNLYPKLGPELKTVQIAAMTKPAKSIVPTEVVNNPPHLPPQKPNPPVHIDIGIYFSERSFQVGICTQSRRHSQNSYVKIFSNSPEIYFSDERILLGQEAQPYHSRPSRNHYFSIYQLITSNDPPIPSYVPIRGVKYHLCSHQVVAIFIYEVLKRHVEDANGVKIGKIVITIPFTPTSAAKEKIRESTRMAGFNDIRILSSVLTAGIGTLQENPYYKNVKKLGPKHIFVVDIQKYSFSMGIVQIGPESIVVKNPYGSANIKKCQGSDFKSIHKSIHDGKTVTAEIKRVFGQIYEAAIDRVLQNIGGVKLESIVINKEVDFPLTATLMNILKSQVNDVLPGHPLLGASILAAANSGSFVSHGIRQTLPDHITVSDSRRSDIILTTGLKSKPKVFPFLYQHFSGSRLVGSFVYKIPIPFDTKSPLVLGVKLEERYDDNLLFEICCYDLTFYLKPRDYLDKILSFILGDGPFDLEIQCFVDEDGVFTFKSHYDPGILSQSSPQLQPRRLDKVTCASSSSNYCGNTSEYIKIIRMYAQNAR